MQDGSNNAAANTAVRTRDPKRLVRWGKRPPPQKLSWAVDKLIRNNAVNSIAGEPGAGKSRMAAHLAAAIASGTPFLGRETMQGPVLYINADDAEDGPKTYADAAARFLGYESVDSLPLWFVNLDEIEGAFEHGLHHESAQVWLEEAATHIADVEGTPLRLIIVDTLETAFMQLDSNKGQNMLVANRALARMASVEGHPGVVTLDHTAKPKDGEGPRKSASGSQQKKATVRSLHILSSTQSGADQSHALNLQWEQTKNNAGLLSTIHVRLTMDDAALIDRLELVDAPRNTQRPKQDTAYDYVLNLLRDARGGWLIQKDAVTQTVNATGTGKRTVHEAIRELRTRSDVEVRVFEGRGNPQGLRLKHAKDAESDHSDEVDARDVASIPSRLGQDMSHFEAVSLPPPGAQSN